MNTTPTIDTVRLPMLLTQLRLPTVGRLWQAIAETADRESWPAAKTLAVLMEHEIAERAQRRTARHLLEARLPPGKTLDRFDFTAVASISKARVTALAEGDSWLAISARYERRSLLITANQPFGAWDAIFPDPAMTVAAIDRLVHHAIILEMNRHSPDSHAD